ncbi:DUF418 domain-containing protein [Corynebacterium mycetoides]|uniref:DUF418 domain-containing protein n=1 Tax=Corynebacterium mycetoides TaxID=38302 RepID=UPI000A4EA07E|nr:DUF418 domain-containing protein [Corynebacterium mycetoides]
MQKRAAQAHAAPRWAYPLIALGKRSMSGYLAQSLLFIILASPFGFGLGLDGTSPASSGWACSSADHAAFCLRPRGHPHPGPFEWVHRRIAYGRTGAIEPRPAHA